MRRLWRWLFARCDAEHPFEEGRSCHRFWWHDKSDWHFDDRSAW